MRCDPHAFVPRILKAPEERSVYRKQRQIQTNLQQKTTDLSSLTGGESVDVQTLEKQAAFLQKKAEGVRQMEEKLDGYDAQLKAMRASLLEKCRLNPQDPPGLMWGKMLRLRTAKMTNEAMAALDRYAALNTNDPNAAICAANAKAYFAKEADYPKDQGVMVMAFENNKPHSVIQIGDILLRRNGKIIGSSDQWAADPGDPKIVNNTFLLLRRQSDGTFHEMEVTSNPSNPRIAVSDLRESQ